MATLKVWKQTPDSTLWREKKNAEGRELGKSRRRRGEKGRMEKAQKKVS